MVMADFDQKLKKSEPAKTKKPIRVLHITTTMNHGGLETMLMNYYRQIDRSQVQFDFLIHRNQESDYEKEILSLGGQIYRVPPLKPLSLSYHKALKDFFRNHPEYSIIHVHQDCLSSIILSVAKQSGIPVRIAHCHSSSQDRNWRYPIKLFYKTKIAKNATSLMSCSFKSGLWMFGTDKFDILNNAIDTQKHAFSEPERIRIRNSLGLGDENFLIGHVGRFNTVKNQIFLVQFFSEYLKVNQNARLVLVGGGPELNECREEAARLDISEQVIFTGFRDDIPSLMSAMDLFMMPSLYEGTPMVLVEAQASGLPCLISDTVPEDCNLTSAVKRCSLNSGFDQWIEAVQTIEFPDRKTADRLVRSKGFDIRENVNWLMDYYLTASENQLGNF